MKKFLIIVSFFCTVLVAKSQNLTVEGTAPNLYITHTVAPKENFYSVGRLYNQTPKLIASFNAIAMEKGLTIGQHIKIPLNPQNLDVSANAASGETLIPLTHVVTKSETLSKIGSDHHVAAQTLKQWNNLSSDNIAPGTPLVVGHLKMQAANSVAKVASNAPVSNQQVIAKQETSAEQKQVVQETKKEETSAVVAQTAGAEKKETSPVVKQEPVKQTETASSTPVKETPAKQEAIKEAPAKQEVVKETPAKEAPLKETPVKVDEAKKSETYSYSTTSNLGSVEGVFANVFTTETSQKSLSNKSGEAATFKSTSGWQDKKYYVLMNDIAPGTILKIASSENKIVYAKVLGSMPDMKENTGLMMRISNAAASYLGIIDPKFPVQISYYQ